jgi:hypothetical protein
MHQFNNYPNFKFNLSSMNSIYIPNIPVAFSEQMVAEIFKTFQIGSVERVDFLAPHEHNVRIRKVFVHFTPYNSERMCAIAQQHAHNESYRLIVDGQGHFWDLCENKRPIPTSTFNIHQLTENMRVIQANFESKITDLTAQVAAIPLMQAEIAELRSRIAYLEDPEWLTSTGTGFQTDPLTMTMLNDDDDDDEDDEDDAMDDCVSENGSEDYDVAAVHPCDEQAYDEAAMVSSHEDEDEDEEYDYEYDATSDAGYLTPIRMACDDVPKTAEEFRNEIENHFVIQRATSAPPLMRTASLHYHGHDINDINQEFEMEWV